jgi:diaminopimelate epimerase
LLVAPGELLEPLTAERVRRLCDYHYGVGSDGLVEVLSVDGNRAELRVWNPDGTTAELSGNGARIAAAWLARRAKTERVALRVGPRDLEAFVRDDGLVELELGSVEVGATEMLDLGDERVEVIPVSVGNPHAVVRRDPERAELRRLGPRIERHARFPERTNVQLGVSGDGCCCERLVRESCHRPSPRWRPARRARRRRTRAAHGTGRGDLPR